MVSPIAMSWPADVKNHPLTWDDWAHSCLQLVYPRFSSAVIPYDQPLSIEIHLTNQQQPPLVIIDTLCADIAPWKWRKEPRMMTSCP